MQDSIGAARNASAAAMKELFNGVKAKVWYLCSTLLENDREAERAAAAAFQDVWQEILEGRVGSAEAFDNIVLRKAVTGIIAGVRKRDSRALRVPAGYQFLLRLDSSDAKTGTDGLDTVMKTLPVSHRLVYTVQGVYGGTAAETAWLLGMGVKTAEMFLDVEEENIRRAAEAAGGNAAGMTREKVLTALKEGAAAAVCPASVETEVQNQIQAACKPVLEERRKKKAITFVGVAAVAAVIIFAVVAIVASHMSTGDSGGTSSSAVSSSSSSSTSASGSTSSGSESTSGSGSTSGSESTSGSGSTSGSESTSGSGSGSGSESTSASGSGSGSESTSASSSSSSSESSSSSSSSSEAASSSSSSAEEFVFEPEYEAAIEIADYGTVKVGLDQDAAPETVANFVALARDGFYDGLTFHRIMEGFMMQGGDPNGDGTGGSDETIKGEFSSNGFDNPLSHTRGAISMARSGDMDGASSQFFIVHEDSTFLDGDYACFGYVTEGMDVVDAICTAAEPTDENGTIPADAQPVITSITITEL